MHKMIFTAFIAVCFSITLASAHASACCDDQQPAGSSAVAGSSATAGVTTNITPVSNNASISSSETNVGVQANPTAVGVGNGGTGIGIGGGASANASNGDQVMVLDLSNHSKNYNRQHTSPYGVAPMPAAQMFDSWEGGAWNRTNIRRFVYDKNTSGDISVEFDVERESGKFFYKDISPVDHVFTVGYLYDPAEQNPENRVKYYQPVGKYVGFWNVVLSEEDSLDEALFYMIDLAMKNGADQVEVLQWSGRKKPTVNGWSVGFGGSGSALMGPDEELAGSIGGGTHIGKSSIVKEEQPFLSVKFWKSDDGVTTSSALPSRDTATDANIKVSPLVTQ